MKVIATKRGYDNVTLREEGDVFDMPDGSKGSWFEPVEKPKAKAKDDKAAQAGDVKAGDLA